MKPGKRPHGQIRQSQLVTTFGPGSLVDLPDHSVIIGGLDDWSPSREVVLEPRLQQKVAEILREPTIGLEAPPADQDDPRATPTGITAWQFPEWFITRDVLQRDRDDSEHVRARALVHRKALTRARFITEDRKKHKVVPVRFVRACRRGHIDDIDWYQFVHRGEPPHRRQLWLVETGTSGDIAEVSVECDCGEARSITEATVQSGRPLGTCSGFRPWLGAFSRETCDEASRLLVRNASNAYFAQTQSVISIPDSDEKLAEAVDQVWEDLLEHVEELDDLRYERRKKPRVRDVLEGYSDDEVMAAIRAKKPGALAAEPKSVKLAELETLFRSEDELGHDRPQGVFYARALPEAEWRANVTWPLERVVLVHRLREVTAQVGFTRFEAYGPNVEGELEMNVQPASLARELSWVPAVENRGEGVFLGFKREVIDKWQQRAPVVARGKQLLDAFELWKKEHPHARREFFGLPYVLLHSLSHLLITAVSLECGYPASSIRERVYALGNAGYGILLYTGSPDAEGTLGGLVDVGRNIARHLEAALELGKLCSGDPVCSQRDPSSQLERRFLQGSACHSCLLIAEPSCEQRNDFLDRALVVPTISRLGAELFSGAQA